MAGGLRAAIQARGTVLERNAKKTRFAIVATLFIAFFFSIGVLFFVKYRNAVASAEAEEVVSRSELISAEVILTLLTIFE